MGKSRKGFPAQQAVDGQDLAATGEWAHQHTHDISSAMSLPDRLDVKEREWWAGENRLAHDEQSGAREGRRKGAVSDVTTFNLPTGAYRQFSHTSPILVDITCSDSGLGAHVRQLQAESGS